MSKPSILFLGTFPSNRGGSGVVHELVINGLHKLGHEIAAITILSADALQHPATALAPSIAVHTVDVATERNSSAKPTRAEMAEECRRIVALSRDITTTFRPDIVFVGRADFKDPALEIASQFDVPIVAVDHGASSAHLDGYFEISEVHRLGPLCDEAACIVAVANYRAANLLRTGLENVIAIPNAADINIFGPGPKSAQLIETLGVPADVPLIAHVSNLRPLKCVSDYLSAVQRLAGNGCDIHAIVVGDGDMRAACEIQVRSLGIADRVTFTGWFDRAQMVELYRSVELIVQPSEIEAAPMAVLEAMASGCAVVASDIRAHREMMQHDRTGVLVPFGDIDAFAEAIASLFDDPERRRQITDAALESSRLRTVEAMVAAYSEVLISVAQMPKTARSLQPSDCEQSTAFE